MLFFVPVLLPAQPPAIHHTPSEYLLSGHRTQIQAQITSPGGIKLARAYFKATDTAHYNFVAMPCEGSACSAVLPKATQTTSGIRYQILFVDNAEKIYKSQPYVVSIDNTKPIPPQQQTGSVGRLAVKTELPKAPKRIEGFTDDMTYDAVESSARFGTSAGQYLLMGKQGSSTVIAASGTEGGAAATTTAAAQTGGMSTTTMALIGGGAVLAGGGAGPRWHSAAAVATVRPHPTTPASP